MKFNPAPERKVSVEATHKYLIDIYDLLTIKGFEGDTYWVEFEDSEYHVHQDIGFFNITPADHSTRNAGVDECLAGLFKLHLECERDQISVLKKFFEPAEEYAPALVVGAKNVMNMLLFMNRFQGHIEEGRLFRTEIRNGELVIVTPHKRFSYFHAFADEAKDFAESLEMVFSIFRQRSKAR